MKCPDFIKLGSPVYEWLTRLMTSYTETFSKGAPTSEEIEEVA